MDTNEDGTLSKDEMRAHAQFIYEATHPDAPKQGRVMKVHKSEENDIRAL